MTPKVVRELWKELGFKKAEEIVSLKGKKRKDVIITCRAKFMAIGYSLGHAYYEGNMNEGYLQDLTFKGEAVKRILLVLGDKDFFNLVNMSKEDG